MIPSLASWMAHRSPRVRAAVAVVLGAVSALALPPFQLFPLLWVTFPLLLCLLDGVKTHKGAFALGWAFGFGFFVAGLHWIAFSFFIDADTFGLLAAPAVALIAAYCGLYPGLTLLLLRQSRVHGLGRVLLFAGLWTVTEIARGTLFTGFPWNPIGLVWVGMLPMLQGAAWIGASGVSLLTVLLATVPILLTERRSTPLGVSLLALAALITLGTLRVPSDPMPTAPGVMVRIVQPSIPQTQKWERDAALGSFRKYLIMSGHSAAGANSSPQTPTAIIWGETAIPYSLDGVDREVEGAIARAVPTNNPNAVIISGVSRRTPVGQAPFQQWNSLQAFTSDGRTVATFDKAHLVPGGEYIPLHQYIPLPAIAADIDYSAGPGPRTLDIPGLPPVGPLICYEVIFPGAVVDPKRRPEWLLNLTNDGWFEGSIGPLQHFALARMRAIEEGLPLVRAANTGVSGVIDPYGRVLNNLGQGVDAVLDSPLPKALPPTLYSRGGELIPLTLAFLVALGGFVMDRRRHKR